MVYEGLTQKEATKKIGITEAYFSRWKNDNKSTYEELQTKYHRQFMGNLVTPALQTLRKLLDSDNDNVRLNAVKDILDRTGHKPIEKQEVAHSGDMNIKQSPYDELSVEELKELLEYADD
jgi:transposase